MFPGFGFSSLLFEWVLRTRNYTEKKKLAGNSDIFDVLKHETNLLLTKCTTQDFCSSFYFHPICSSCILDSAIIFFAQRPGVHSRRKTWLSYTSNWFMICCPRRVIDRFCDLLKTRNQCFSLAERGTYVHKTLAVLRHPRSELSCREQSFCLFRESRFSPSFASDLVVKRNIFIASQ